MHVKKESITWGHTVATYIHDTSYSNNILQLNGEVCVVPGIEIKLSFKNVSISLAKELPEKSCIYNYILEHERHHTEIYKKGLEQMAIDLTVLFNEKYATKRFVGFNAAQVDKEAQIYSIRHRRLSLAGVEYPYYWVSCSCKLSSLNK